MLSLYSDASDTEELGPGTSVADLSAAGERATVDDRQLNNGHERSQIIGLPLSGPIQCPGCRNEGRNMKFLSEKDFNTHATEAHHEMEVQWCCNKCGKAYDRIHPLKCHIPKCKGAREDTNGEFRCSACGIAYGSQRGLSTHERHRHPAIRNEKRTGGVAPGAAKKGRKATVWSEEETALLRVLDRQHGGSTRVNVKIKEHIPGKTLKQISDKRRQLKPPENVVECITIDESDSETESCEMDGVQTSPDRGESSQVPTVSGAWQEALIESISAPGPEKEEWTSIVNEMAMLAIEDRSSNEQLEKVVGDVLCVLQGDKPTTEPRRARGREGRNKTGSDGARASRRTRGRRFRYSRYQEIFEKCPRKLADMAISGNTIDQVGGEICYPETGDIERLYTALWGTAGPRTVKLAMNENRQSNVPTSEIWRSVEAEEIVRRIAKMKPGTAAGLDGIQKTHIKRVSAVQVLVKLFNLLLLKGYYPKQFKANRTTLIPKPGKDTKDACNWRPITIGSLIGRLLSNMIDSRIRDNIVLSDRQKGFMKDNGCKHNVAIIKSVLDRMKRSKGGVITVVDISKAFDTVPHASLVASLAAKGMPTEVTSFIKEMYNGCHTTIKGSNGGCIKITLQRGVKQGDPLSPMLFNTVVDPIITNIERATKGIDLNGNNVTILAFADDLVLVGQDRDEAARQLKMLGEYLKNLGMELSIPKCASIEVVAKNKTWFLHDPKIMMGCDRIPTICPGETTKYLGITLDPWAGLRVDKEKLETITRAASAIARMALKPHQKVAVIRTYLLPRIIYELMTSPPPIKVLKELDHEVKQVVKGILKLRVIYSEKSHGGIGLQRIEDIVKLAVIRNGIKMLCSTDDVVQEALNGESGMIEKYAKSLNLSWPTTMTKVEEARRECKIRDTEKWRQLISQGQGVTDFGHDRIGNAWLFNPSLLRPSRYLDALKLRTNTFGTKVALRRASKNLDVACRRCKVQVETLGHVLGNCTHTKGMRMRRHDEIKEFIGNRLSGSHAVFF